MIGPRGGVKGGARRLAGMGLLAALVLLGPGGPAARGAEPALDADLAVAEPSDYRFEPYRAPTPATLAGAQVLSTAQAEALWRAKGAVFVDVLPRPPRPANLPAGTLWRDLPHDSIPGSAWLPNVGFGALDGASQRYFEDGLTALTGGDRHRLVVLFCLKDCWMSWNAAKRALAGGYDRVAWFPEGVDGWKAAGLPLERLEPWQPGPAR
ncbi:PQQ-dependent catabolism-associated CXXCW motif protein [Xanthobacter variabilis]|uniref:PQQ-dependent catabolism-associated CXXCW motif protein n=1 Tax=Xanthobacter variabilis TaxID=3119932 RepID=UPI00374F193F